MTYTLFPHQEKGAAFLAAQPGVRGLYFGMGTGKTITALEAVTRVEPGARVLIIAPPIALTMWQAEARAYLAHLVDEHGVQILKTGKAAVSEDARIVVVSYAIAAKRSGELRDWLGGGVLICDESHALKNPSAKRTKAILGAAGIARGAGHTWLLTGTPVTRWNDDLFTFLCNADAKGMVERCGGTRCNLERFQLRYTIRQERQWPGARWPVKAVVGNQRTAELAEWMYGDGLAMRVDLDEVYQDMPALTINRYTIPLDTDAQLRMAIKSLDKMTLAEIEQKARAQEPALATIRRQIGVARVKAAVAEILERVDSGQSILVGAWHTEVIDALHDALLAKGISQVAVIDGRTPGAHRDTFTATWNTGQIQVLIGQIAAMGVSLNLQQGGSQIVVVEEDWSPAIMDQFYARLWRFGQKKHVHVDILQDDTKLSKAVSRIAGAKARAHELMNQIGREVGGTQ
jgi:SWI/SNF-related matrix-associated actin-dependent regulator 1 of chromatin subfamily A